MGMPSAQVQAGTQPPAGQFFQAGQFTTGMGSGTPGQPVPLNAMSLPLNPVAGEAGSPEARAAAFAKQQAELQARIASRAAAAGKPTEFSLSEADQNGNAVTYARWNPDAPTGASSVPQQSTPFTTGGGSPAAQVQSQMTSQPSVGPQSQPTTQSKGKGGSGQQTFANPPTTGQPSFGQPNRYSNTVGQWDNASIQRRPSSGKGAGMNQQSPTGGGKGKG